jgi:hypothetical protein
MRWLSKCRSELAGEHGRRDVGARASVSAGASPPPPDWPHGAEELRAVAIHWEKYRMKRALKMKRVPSSIVRFATLSAALVACSGGIDPQGAPADREQQAAATAASAPLFPSDSYWYRDVSGSAVAPESAGIVAAIGAFGSGGHFDVDFSFNVLHAAASDPRYAPELDSDYDPDNDHVAVPVPSSGALEGEDGYVCESGGDCHLVVVDDSTHTLFELWQANFDGQKLTATQESAWNLLTHYGAEGRGYGCTSADAAGLPILPGLIGVSEVHAGSVDHALRFILPNAKIRPGFVAPATHLTHAASSSSGAPYGTRLRLRASFDESKLASEGAKTVARALKKYGMILADGGQIPLTAESDQLYGSDMKWDGLLTRSDLRAIAVSDFDVVDFGQVRTDTDCARSN